MDFYLYFLTALLLDMIIGDPRWYPHPVRIIGALCQRFEQISRKCIQNQKLAGSITVFSILGFTFTAVASALFILGKYSVAGQTLFSVIVLYSFIAIKDLLLHSKVVYNCLVPTEDIDCARVAIGQIVGRDTDQLSSEEICKACVETVAENLVDGITAPLFWAILFTFFAPITSFSAISMAAIGVALYKSVNTMDSLFGYKNDRYLEFGWAAARLDDLVNYIPARLSGICIVLTALIIGYDWRNSYKIFFRDRLNHSSPNAGHTESAIAGALNVQLGGISYYFGKKVEKPNIGNAIHQVTPHHILVTNKCVIYSAAIFLLILFLARISIFELI